MNNNSGSAFDRAVSKMLQEYPNANYTQAADGSYLMIDINPNGKDLDDFSESDSKVLRDSVNGIQLINKELGFSDALFTKMGETSPIMGRQTDENDKYRVSWSVTLDHNLVVMYEKK